MKIVFHENFHSCYDNDPAASKGRMKGMVEAVAKKWQIVKPQPATKSDILRCHTLVHFENEAKDREVFEMAMLSAGGAIMAAEIAANGDDAFALIRPPGHHASPSSAWGFCHFNNIAVALLYLENKGVIKSALILDIDLHFGDGTNNIFSRKHGYVYLHPEGNDRSSYIDNLTRQIETAPRADIVAVSAGFDRAFGDWGNMLLPEDYEKIGETVKKFAISNCSGRFFAVLEGGYNHELLGNNLASFLTGVETMATFH